MTRIVAFLFFSTPGSRKRGGVSRDVPKYQLYQSLYTLTLSDLLFFCSFDSYHTKVIIVFEVPLFMFPFVLFSTMCSG